ncbi:glycosyltransferase family 4 protein [bacterium]|nr:glycosyltransferase family 4 protein [bacterium]
MTKFFFYLPFFPSWETGGHKYQLILFQYFSKAYDNIFPFGFSKLERKSTQNYPLRILIGLYHFLTIPKNSVLVLTETTFLEFTIPLFLNRFFKKHSFVVIVHHLVQKTRYNFFRKKLEDNFYQNVHKIITVSETTHKNLRELNLGLWEIPVVPPGLDVNFRRIPTEKQFPKKFRILFVGTVEERKGLIFLVRASKFIKNKDFELNIVGNFQESSAYFKLLQQEIKSNKLEKNIQFLGKVEESLLEDFYLNSSIFAFPSLWEGYGMVVAEAMAYGLPVVATKIPAFEELIENGNTGILVEPQNSQQLGEALNELFDNHSLQKKLSENAQAKAKTFLNWEQTAQKVWEFVKE